MIKCLKKLQAALFAVAVLLMFALVFTFVYGAGSGNKILPVAEAAEEGVVYQHGSDIGREKAGSVTEVGNASQLKDAIQANQNISLTASFTANLGDSNAFWHTGNYTGKLYGNGFTITIQLKDNNNGFTQVNGTGSGNNSGSYGGIIGTLGTNGGVYDLNIVMHGYISYATYGGTGDLNMGGIVGLLNGGEIDNCTFSFIGNNGYRMSATTWNTANWAGVGGIVGRATSGSVTNCTVTNDAWIEGGAATNDSQANVNTDVVMGGVGLVIGIVDSGMTGSGKIDNIIVHGSGNVKSGGYASALGMIFSGNSTYEITNYINGYTGQYVSANNGNSDNIVKHDGADSVRVTISNYYIDGSRTGISSSNASWTISGTITIQSVANRSVYLDPTASSFADSLVIAFSGQSEAAPGITRTWTLKGPNGNSIATTQEISGDTVVFAGLSSSVSTWSSGGTFTASISVDDSTMTGLPALTQYEHGYVDGEYSPAEGATGIAQEAGNGNVTFASVFSPTAGGDVSGSYYLTEDIWVSGFSGKTMTSGAVLDGNGHTIYISRLAQPVENYGAADIGGIVGNMNGGTIKNLRIVIVGDYALQTSESRGNNRALGFGLVAGRMQNNATIENVTVVLQGNVSVNETDTTALGGVSGNLSGNAKIENVTVQLDGNLSCTATYPFVAGFVGNTDSGSSGTYTNIILKGSGTFGGNATNAGGSEPLFTAAITILPGSGSAPLATIDGFIYALTADNPVAASSYSSYGYVSQNLASDNIANPGDGKPADGYVAYSNIFAVTTMTPYYSGHHAGNTYIAMKTTATITPEVQGAIGSRVTPYFVPGSTTDITLVATAGDWNGITRLQTNGNGTGDYRAEGNYKIVTVAKENAYDSIGGTITLSEYVAATANAANKNVTYNGAVADFAITVTVGDSTLTPGDDYTLNFESVTGYNSSEAPFNAGTYSVTVTLNADNDYNFENNGNLVKSLTISGLVIAKADLPKTVTVSIEGWTYGASGNAPQMSGLPSGVTEENVSYTYTGRGDTSYSDSIPPANAGEYTVTATINATSNYNGGTVSANFTVAKAPFPEGISVTMGGWTYGDAPKSPSIDGADEISGADRTFLYEGTGATEYSSSDKPSDAGTYTLTVTYDESANYLGGSVVSGEFTIAPYKLIFRVESTGNIIYGSYAEPNGVMTVTPTNDPDEGFVGEYPSYDITFVYTLDSGEYNEDTVADIAAGTTVHVRAVVSVVDPATDLIDTNYTISFENGTDALDYVIQQRPISLSASDGQGVYGALDYNAEYFAGLFELSGALGSDTVASLFDVNIEGQGGASLPNAGTYTVTASLNDTEAARNYTLAADSVNSYTYTITPFIVTGSIEPSAEYSGSAFTPRWTVTETLPNNETQEGMEVSVAYALNNSDSGVTTIQNVGQYTVTVTLGNTNYAFAAGEGTSQKQGYSFEVTKAENIFTTEFDPRWTYGEGPTIKPPVAKFGDVSVTYYSDDSYNNVVESFSSTTAAGTYYYVITVEENANWTNESMTLSGSFPVEKAQTTVTLSVEEGAVFDGAAYDGKITVELGNSAVSLGDVTWQYKVGDGGWTEGLPVNAGTYTISIKTYSNSGNVTVTNLGDATAQLVILPKDITFNAELAENASLTYGDALEQDQMNALVNVGVAEGQESIDFTFTVSLMAGDVAFGSTTGADAIVTVSVEVTATDSNYNAANPAALELTVQRRVITGALRATSATYNGAVQTVEFVPVNVANGDAVTFAYSYTLNNNSAESILGAGTYTVKVTLAGDNTVNNNYILDVDELTFTVEKLTINATLTASGTAVQDGAIDITGSDKITFDTDTNGVLVIMLGGEEVARVTVTFAAADGTQYTPDGIAFAIAYVDFGTGIEAGTGVTTRSVTVSFSDTNFALGETLGGVTFEVSGNISVADGITSTVTYEPGTSYDTDYFKDNKYFVTSNPDDVANITVTIYRGENASGEEIGEGIISDAGTYYVQGTIDGAAAGFKFTIAKADNAWTVEFNREGWTYGSQAGAYTAPQAASGEPEITYYKLTADGGRELYEGVFDNTTGAGTYVAVVTVAESTNYNVLTKEYQFVVAKADNSLTTGFSAGWTYGEEPVISEPSAAFGEVTVTYYTDAERQHAVDREFFTSTTDAATYYVTVCVAESENYNKFSADFSFTVEKAGNSLTTEFTAGWTYGEEPVISEPSAAFGDVVVTYYADEEHLEQLDRGSFTSATNAGTYYCVITVEGTDNYDGISEERSFEIKKASVAVDFDIENTVYNGEEIGDPVLKEGSNPGGAAVTVTFTADSGSLNANDRPRNAGSYTVTVAVTESTNYLGGEASKSFEITRKEVTVTVENADSLVYTGEPIELALAADGIVAADEGVVIPVATAAEGDVRDAKEYHLTFSFDGEGSGNYVLTQEEGVVTVSAAQTTVSVADANGVYDGAAYDGSMTVTLNTVGLSLGEITWQYRVGDGGWTEGLPVNAGTYTISIKTYSNSGNVTVTNLGDATAQLVIDKAQVRYTATLAEGAEIVFGDTFTQEQMNALVTVTDDGGVTVDTYTVRLELADGSAYDASVPVGTAVSIVIVPVVDEANYEVTVTEGLTLSVQSKAIDIVLDTDGNGETDEDKISSGATVTIQQGESLALAAAVEAFLEEQGIPAGSYRILIDGAEFAGTENLAARTYRMQVSLTGGYQGVLEFMLTVEGDDEPVAPPVDPDEPDDPDPDEPVDPDPEEPVDPDEPGTPDEPEQPAQPDGEGFPGWAIAVIVCGGLLVIAAVTGIAVAAARKRKKSGDKK